MPAVSAFLKHQESRTEVRSNHRLHHTCMSPLTVVPATGILRILLARFIPIYKSLRVLPYLPKLRQAFHTPPTLAMASKKAPAANNKRKPNESISTPSKKARSSGSASEDAKDEEEHGIVDREFYPPEMTNERCHQYINGELTRPIESLDAALGQTRSKRSEVKLKNAVIHWFKCDLRLKDNKSLHLASEKARTKGVPLICLYIISPQDYKAHMTAPVRVDFVLRTLELLREDLAKLDIPLYVETVERRKTILDRIFELCEKWGASHLFANIEYEVDELRREASLVTKGLEKGVAVEVVPDTCVVAPGELSSKSGTQYAVYSPWFRAWLAYLHEHPDQLNAYNAPTKNPTKARSSFKNLFDHPIPAAPENKKLTAEEQKRFRSMWPPGEHEAEARLEKFLKQKATEYQDMRNYPASNATAVVSVHLASGTLSARTAIARARDANSAKKLDGGKPGIAGWISEVAWRDFYKHVLAHWPHIW